MTATAYFLVWCYTTTIASCQTVPNLPDAAACAEVFAMVKAVRGAARLEQCGGPYRILLPSTAPAGGPYMIAK